MQNELTQEQLDALVANFDADGWNNSPDEKRPPRQEYLKMETLMRELHALVHEGKEDEADKVRDQMDCPWYDLTEEEQERLRWLSHDLNYQYGAIDLQTYERLNLRRKVKQSPPSP
jgi:hypothetical protein